MLTVNPLKVDGRNQMKEIANEKGWLKDADAIEIGENDDDYDEYIAFANSFSEQFKYVVSFVEGNHRFIIITHSILGLAAIPTTVFDGKSGVPVTNEHLGVKPTAEKRNYLETVKELLKDEEGNNAFSRHLNIEIITAKKDATKERTAAKLSLECLRSASAEVSEVRNNSSKMNNFDQLKVLFASVNTADKSDSKPCSIHIAGIEMTKDDFYVNFDPEEFMEKHESLQPYFRNPNLHFQLLDLVTLKKNGTTNSVIMKGRPAAVFEEIRYKKPKSTTNEDGTVTVTDDYYVLKCRDMFLWYSIIWTNEKHFKPTDPKPLEVLCKAYYLAVNEKVDNILAPSWNDSKFESLPERVREVVDVNVLTDDDKNNRGRPGTGSVEAQLNAVNEMMYHMIITSEYTDNKQLLMQVVDKLSGEFGKDAEAQRVHLGKCKRTTLYIMEH